jgi:hypothetical protein
MSGDSASRRRKEPAQSRRTPMFEVRHDCRSATRPIRRVYGLPARPRAP